MGGEGAPVAEPAEPQPMATAVVTGANTGLGYEAAAALARIGVHVVMACRNLEKGAAALADLRAAVPGAAASVAHLDVSEPDSIREFARWLPGEIGALDLLVNNAGIVGMPLLRNSRGHELHLATNFLGAFALSGLLLPHFGRRGPARIVNVGSLAHGFAKLDLDDPSWERSRYSPWKAYARSKLALLLHTLELDRRLRSSGSHVRALAAHPGFAATDIGRHHPVLSRRNRYLGWLYDLLEPLFPPASQAVRPILHAATAASARGGECWGPGGWLEIRGEPGLAAVPALANEIRTAATLWGLAESMTGIHYLSESTAQAGSPEADARPRDGLAGGTA